MTFISVSNRSFFLSGIGSPQRLDSFPTRRSSDLGNGRRRRGRGGRLRRGRRRGGRLRRGRSEEHTSELQSRGHLVCRLLLEKKKARLAVARVVGIEDAGDRDALAHHIRGQGLGDP